PLVVEREEHEIPAMHGLPEALGKVVATRKRSRRFADARAQDDQLLDERQRASRIVARDEIRDLLQILNRLRPQPIAAHRPLLATAPASARTPFAPTPPPRAPPPPRPPAPGGRGSSSSSATTARARRH